MADIKRVEEQTNPYLDTKKKQKQNHGVYAGFRGGHFVPQENSILKQVRL